MLNDRKPHFLEVYLPNLSSDRLKVPSKFVKHLEARTSGSVSLRGPSGNSWHMNLIEHNGHLFLDNGWRAFVKDHSVQCGDSLVFRYDGNLEFSVQIFDQTSCEKEEAYYAKCSQDLLDLNGTFGKKRRREAETAFCNKSGERKIKGTWKPVHLDLEAADKEQKLEASDNEDPELEGIVINRYFHRTQNLVKASERPIVLAMPSFGKGQIIPTVNIHRKTKASNPKKVCQTKKKTEFQKKTSISKFIEARAAHYFTSSFPYFARVMKVSNVNDRANLKIPVNFSKAHLPSCRIKVTLRNLNGECWMLNCVPTAKRHSTMHTLSGGWLAFVRGNSIKLEDVCIFELVDKFEMRVHILRLGLEGLDSQIQKGSIDMCGVGSGGLPLQIVEIVPQDDEVHPSKISEQINEPSIYNRKDPEVIPGPHEDTSSSSDTCDDTTAMTSPVNSAPSPMSRICNKSTDQPLGRTDEGTVSYQTSRRSQADLDTISTVPIAVTTEDAREPLSFISAFPNFMKVMMNSNVGGSFTLGIPRKFSAAHLPSYKTEIVLRNVRGNCWNIISGRYGHQTKFCGGWMSFVRQNGVKVGDTCVFELVDERVLQVHIFEASHRVQECPSNDAADDDSTASVESTRFTVQPEM